MKKKEGDTQYRYLFSPGIAVKLRGQTCGSLILIGNIKICLGNKLVESVTINECRD